MTDDGEPAGSTVELALAFVQDARKGMRKSAEAVLCNVSRRLTCKPVLSHTGQLRLQSIPLPGLAKTGGNSTAALTDSSPIFLINELPFDGMTAQQIGEFWKQPLWRLPSQSKIPSKATQGLVRTLYLGASVGEVL